MICKKCIHSDVCRYKVPAMYACENFKDSNEINSAIEKQIPKKCTDGFHKEKVIDGRCPTCSFRQSIGDIEWKRQFNKYCRNCGQALDWSDTE
jgi:hypothetical protein